MIHGSLRGKKIHKTQILRESWVWGNDVTELIKKYIKGYSLNVPCGMSKLGDVRVDIDPNLNPDIVADMNDLPFENETFDTIISDPLWKLNFFKRMIPFFECVRVCKVGGVIIYNATWIPTSKAVKLKEVIVRQENSFTNSSIISIFEKVNNEFDNYKLKKNKLNQGS